MQGRSRNVQVSVRIRPLLASDARRRREREGDGGDGGGEEGYAYEPYDERTVQETGSTKGSKFNHVWGPDTQNEYIYQSIGQRCVSDVFQGYNVCVFMYGQTGSGKTHTMTGNPSDPGLIPRCCDELFRTIGADKTRQYLVRASYLEIYNERIFDLLQSKRELQLRLNGDKDEFVAVGVKETIVKSSRDLTALLEKGQAAKIMGVSNLNDHSSRSHCLFSVIVESAVHATGGGAAAGGAESTEGSAEEQKGGEEKEATPAEGGDAGAPGLVTVARLQLVDLAGSETVSSTNSAQRRETGNINQSLGSLKTVIKAKAERAQHIPYRNSELTKLLKGSLGGNSLTHMICCLNPSMEQKRESKFTLSFGSLAQKIVNLPLKNETSDDKEALLRKYQAELAQMRSKLARLSEAEAEVNRLRDMQAAVLTGPEVAEKEAELKAVRKKLANERRALAQEKRRSSELQLNIEVELEKHNQRDEDLAATLAAQEQELAEMRRSLEARYVQAHADLAQAFDEEKAAFQLQQQTVSQQAKEWEAERTRLLQEAQQHRTEQQQMEQQRQIIQVANERVRQQIALVQAKEAELAARESALAGAAPPVGSLAGAAAGVAPEVVSQLQRQLRELQAKYDESQSMQLALRLQLEEYEGRLRQGMSTPRSRLNAALRTAEADVS